MHICIRCCQNKNCTESHSKNQALSFEGSDNSLHITPLKLLWGKWQIINLKSKIWMRLLYRIALPFFWNLDGERHFSLSCCFQMTSPVKCKVYWQNLIYSYISQITWWTEPQFQIQRKQYRRQTARLWKWKFFNTLPIEFKIMPITHFKGSLIPFPKRVINSWYIVHVY